MTLKCLIYLFDRGARDEIVDLLSEVTRTTTAYAENFEQQNAMQLVSTIRAVMIERLKAIDTTADPLKYLQMVDLQCVGALSPILATALSLSGRGVGELVSIDAALLKLDRQGMYAKAHPRKVLNVAEDLFRRLTFERATEGNILTQPWYVRQIIAFAYAEVIRDTIQHIVTVFKDEFVLPAEELVAAKRALLAGQWLQRAMEAFHKAKDQVKVLESSAAEKESVSIMI